MNGGSCPFRPIGGGLSPDSLQERHADRRLRAICRRSLHIKEPNLALLNCHLYEDVLRWPLGCADCSPFSCCPSSVAACSLRWLGLQPPPTRPLVAAGMESTTASPICLSCREWSRRSRPVFAPLRQHVRIAHRALRRRLADTSRLLIFLLRNCLTLVSFLSPPTPGLHCCQTCEIRNAARPPRFDSSAPTLIFDNNHC
jgi:hypothetical protein